MGETSLNMRWNMLQDRACGNVRDNRNPRPDFAFLQKEALFNRLLTRKWLSWLREATFIWYLEGLLALLAMPWLRSAESIRRVGSQWPAVETSSKL